jgi:hypothetical protein
MYYEGIYQPSRALRASSNTNAHQSSQIIAHHTSPEKKLRGNLKLVLNRRWLASVLCCLCLLYLQPGRQIFSPPIIKRDLIDKS